MIARLRAAWMRAPWLSIAFVLALALTVFFGVRMTRTAIYWADPRHTDQAIAGWMSPGYVAMSWSIPRDAMVEMIGQQPGNGRPQPLDRIAAERGRPLETLIAEIEAAIQTYRDTAQ